MERTITIQQIKDVAQEAYNLYKDNTDGKNADYIPYLANIDPKLFRNQYLPDERRNHPTG